jgi:post-segregation antitoxin (ccd killing protein)
MRNALFDPGARKRTVGLTLNADLYAKAKSSGINLSKIAEEALEQRLAEQAKADIDRDLQALNAFVAIHGSFAAMVREHDAAIDDDAPV